MMPTLVVVMTQSNTMPTLVSTLRSWGFEVGVGSDFVGLGSGPMPKSEGGPVGNVSTRVVRDTRIIFVDNPEIVGTFQPDLALSLETEVILAVTQYKDTRITDMSTPLARQAANSLAEKEAHALMNNFQLVRVNITLMSNEEMCRYIERVAKFVAWRRTSQAYNLGAE